MKTTSGLSRSSITPSVLSSVMFATIGVIMAWSDVGACNRTPALVGHRQTTSGTTLRPMGVS
ncbi:MAG: hypothetical protein IPH72_10710 [Sandaracinaceae bacterium]|nr:hypothetical protein [Sandaracinaceae bacterium]